MKKRGASLTRDLAKEKYDGPGGCMVWKCGRRDLDPPGDCR